MTLLNATQHTYSPSEMLSNVLIVAIIVLLYGVYHFFFRRKKDGFQKYIRQFLLPLTFTGGFVVYFIGYQLGNHDHNEGWRIIPNMLESLFSTARLFILGNDLVELEAPFKHEAIFHAMFSLTAALAAFIFISVMVGVFFKNWLVRLKVRFAHANENHFFFGVNPSTIALSTDLLKSDCDRLVVFVNDLYENENQHHYSLLPENALVIKRKSFSESVNLEKEEGLMPIIHDKSNHSHSIGRHESIFHNLNIVRNKIGVAETHLYFLTDDEDWNIEHAKLALDELKMQTTYEKPIRIHVATFSEIAEKHFENYTKLSTNEISVVIHYYASIVSRQLITEYHPVDSVEIDHSTATVKTDFNTLIIGFGKIGTNVLRKLIEQGQFVGSTFSTTVIDESMDNLNGRFEFLYPGLSQNYQLRFVQATVGNSKFYNEIQNLIDQLNYVVISLGGDNLNIQTTLEILGISNLRTNRNLKIFVKLEEESHWKNTLNEYQSQIFVFGEVAKVFSEENILQRKAETRGRIIHDVYNDLIFPNPNKQPFDKISRHEQLSNMSAAEHLYAKVRLLGYDNVDDFSDKFTSNSEFLLSLSDTQKLDLSKGEHLRWNAFHFIHGWTTLPIDQIPGTTQKEKYDNRKNSETKKHSCLISWEELEKLSVVLGKDMQKPDVVSVENMYNFINYNPQNNNG